MLLLGARLQKCYRKSIPLGYHTLVLGAPVEANCASRQRNKYKSKKGMGSLSNKGVNKTGEPNYISFVNTQLTKNTFLL